MLDIKFIVDAATSRLKIHAFKIGLKNKEGK